MKGLQLMLCLTLCGVPAFAHVNDRGMDYRRYKDRYGQSCCDVRDCVAATDFVEAVVDGQAVVRLLIEGIWIVVSNSYVVSEHASDGRAHFCGKLHRGSSNPAEVKPEPTCIILPPRET
jgi:hypothetical protein